LINDLVDSARVASGKLRLEFRPLNFYDIIKNVVNSQKPQAENKNITLEFSADAEDITVFGDAVRLHQIFTNLISNSLKFTPEGGNILIDLKTSATISKLPLKTMGTASIPNFCPEYLLNLHRATKKCLKIRPVLD
jgi:signal transduction histidine kinase